MTRIRQLVFVFSLLVFGSTARAASCENLREVGDVLTFAIPVSAVALTTLKRDWQGAMQLGKTMVFTGASAGLFKQIGEKTRPNAGDSTQSFVSGHSAGGFMGASYMYTRYGKGWGIPAYGLAILTAYSRVCAQAHFADDVLGGALVAMMSNWYATSPHPDAGRIYPSYTSNGLELTWRTFFGGNRHPVDPPNFDPRYRMVFEFGAVTQDKNIVRAPADLGSTIDLAALEAEFHMTARLLFERYLTDKHEFTVWYGPMGMTDFGQPDQPFRVGDEIFDPSDPDAEVFDTNYRWWDLRAGYRYNLVNSERWNFRVGVSLQVSRTEFEVEQRNSDAVIVKTGRGEETAVAPLIHLSGAYHFNPRWSVSAEVDGISAGNEHYWNAGLWLRFQPTQLWDMSVGGRLIDGKIDRDSLFNEVEVSDIAFQIGRSF